MNNDDLEKGLNNEKNNVDQATERLNNVSGRGFNTVPVRGTNRLHNNSITNSLRNQNQKANNQLVSSRMEKKINNQNNHQRPDLGVANKDDQTKSNSPKNDNVGSRNLQKSLRDKTNKIWLSRRKKQKQKKEENNNQNDVDSSNDNDDTSAQYQMDDMVAKAKRRIKIKIIIYTSIFGFLGILFLAIIMSIFGIDISSTIPAINQGNYGTDKFSSTYEEGTKEYNQEINYYEKLKETSESYTKENGEELKTSYIHSSLIYLYYQIDEYEIVDTIPVDYEKMTNMIDKIVLLMKPSDEKNTIDYEKKGEFYNNLKNSSEFKDYYKDILKNKNIDELLDEIFDLALELDELDREDNTVITSETKVVVKKTSSEESKSSSPTKKVTINNYLADSIYATTDSVTNSELVKAYTIAYSTNIASQNKNLTINSDNALMNNELCSTKEGCSYDKEGKLVDGPGEQSNKNTLYYNGKYYYKKPLTADEENTLNKSISNVFGNVLVNSDGTYPNLDITKITGLGDDYKGILNNTYGEHSLKNIGENSYILDASYGDKKVLVDVIFYDQSNYTGSFCGLKKETIASSGCGVTSMAIVTSTYENDGKYTPTWANDIAKKNGQCGAGRGTDFSHFKYVAKKMGYKTPVIYLKSKANGWKLPKSSYNNVLKHLADGDLVIINVSKGHFTSGGHYMVLGGIDPETKKVYVYDPNNKANSRYRKTGNGWWSFNDIIAPESKAFIIIEKKG